MATLSPLHRRHAAGRSVAAQPLPAKAPLRWLPRWMTLSALLLLLAVFATTLRGAELAEPLADINTGAAPGRGSAPNQFIRISDDLGVFVASDRVHGGELWRTDGTSSGTGLLADICPGLCSSNPSGLVLLGTSIYFRADDGAHGPEPWRIDTTTMAVEMVADVDPGAGSSNPSLFVRADLGQGPRVYFVARPFDTSRRDIYQTGGTPGSTSLALATDFSTISSMVAANNRIYLAATHPGNALGNELYRLNFANGSHGAALVEDIRDGTGSSTIRDLTQAGSKLFFTADDGVHGRELWVQDLVGSATTLVADLRNGTAASFISGLTAFQGRLFFSADDGQAGEELWASDGTEAGTVLIDVRAGASGSAPEKLRVVDDQLLFLAFESDSGRELYRSDGTSEGTVRIEDQLPGSEGFNAFSFEAATAVGGFYLFSDRGQLWRSDGSDNSVQLMGAPFDSPVSLIADAGAYAFIAGSLQSIGEEPFRAAPGSSASPALLRNIGEEVGHSDPFAFTALGSRTVFAASDETAGEEPRAAQGPAQPVVLLGDTRPDSFTSSLFEDRTFVAANGLLFFQPRFRELWVTDGTPAGTRSLGEFGNGIHCMVGDADALYFTFDDSTLDTTELWRSDGTLAGTVALVAEPELFVRSSCSQGDLSLALMGGHVYFAADDGNGFGVELFRVARNGGPVQRVRDILPGSGHSLPQWMTPLGDTLYFVATSTEGQELWKSNGTAQGTVLVRDIHPAGNANPRTLRVFGERLVFTADDEAGRELHISDGTEAGTVRVADLQPGPGSAIPAFQEQLTVSGNRLYFAATESTASGSNLYVSDGTAAGTTRLTLQPGGVTPQDLAAVSDGMLMFSAVSGEAGRELWISDGSVDGTFQLDDIAPGPDHSSPRQLAQTGALVHFSADDGSIGREPWVIAAPSTTVFADSFEAPVP